MGGKVEAVTHFIFLGSKITADGAEMKLRDTWKESYNKSRQHIKKQGHHFTDKRAYNPNYGFPSSMYRYEDWTIKSIEELMVLNCVVGEDTWESLGQQDQANKS